MSQRIARSQLSEFATTHAEPRRRSTEVDRTFELPGSLFGLTFACYFGFLAVMAVGLATPRLAIPLGICAVLLVMALAVPHRWVRMQPKNKSRALSWSRFSQSGIRTATGTVSARDAIVQVLILPVLILLWGLYTVVIFSVS